MSNDKLDVLKEAGNDRAMTKRKIEALGWHARCINLIGVTEVQEAITLFKRACLPSDNPKIRNDYIKMIDHYANTTAVVCEIIKKESLNEKMTISPMRGNMMASPAHCANKEFDTNIDNSVV